MYVCNNIMLCIMMRTFLLFCARHRLTEVILNDLLSDVTQELDFFFTDMPQISSEKYDIILAYVGMILYIYDG